MWKRAGLGLILATLAVTTMRGVFWKSGFGILVDVFAGFLAGMVGLLLFAGVTAGLIFVVKKLPQHFIIASGAALGTLIALKLTPYMGFGWPDGVFYPALPIFLAAQATLAGSLSVVLSKGFKSATGMKKAIPWALLVAALAVDIAGLTWLVGAGSDPYPVKTETYSADINPLPLPNPSQKGGLDVRTLTYGSGKNARRPEFGDDADLLTETVDASLLLPEWKGFKAKMRERYWGFGIKETPVNGLVWYPEGQGPFPLVLIVHGNHRMNDFSDPGYAYLGELLASRGFITVSVDENLINGSWSGDFRGKEMPVRAWLLLEHLRVWRDWNQTLGHRFHQKVDMENIALIGHSRGGEAVSIAAAYNQLPYFPDDANQRFDYRFNIKSLVAIAQIDRRYDRRIELENVNFLALQGSYDSDEPSFHGMRQYARISYSDEEYRLKAGLWIHRANHGQFNTGWGRFDGGPPGRWLLNVGPLISGDDQRQAAKVYVSAFLEATLHGKREYTPLFQDHRLAGNWLPEGSYITRFQDSTYRSLADFEEDINLATASAPGGVIEGKDLTVWREKDLPFRDQSNQRNNAVYLGWDSEKTGDGVTASYSIVLPEDYGLEEKLGHQTLLSFSLAQADEKANPSGKDPGEEPSELSPIDLTIEISDAQGTVARPLLTQFAPISKPHRVRFLKSRRLNKKRYGPEWEPTMQTYEIPLSSFSPINPATIRTIAFTFDQSPTGVVILDEVGFRSARIQLQ